MREFQSFFVYLTAVRSLVRKNGNSKIKKLIGDSTNNKRTVTVMQTVRFLTKIKDRKGAKQLRAVLEVLENDILTARNLRTDAIDLTELTNTYREVVMRQGKLRKNIGIKLSKVG